MKLYVVLLVMVLANTISSSRGVNLNMCRCLKFIQLPKQPRCHIFKHITSVFTPGYPCPDYRLISVHFKWYCLDPVNLHHQECVECFQNRCRKMKIHIGWKVNAGELEGYFWEPDHHYHRQYLVAILIIHLLKPLWI